MRRDPLDYIAGAGRRSVDVRFIRVGKRELFQANHPDLIRDATRSAVLENPEQFDPDRWLDGSAAGRPKFAFYPFGAGTRVCIGEQFAMMEGVLLIAILARQWKFHLVPGQTVELWPQITLRPRHPSISSSKKRKGNSVRDGIHICVTGRCKEVSGILAR
jgi:hypothetical protein